MSQIIVTLYQRPIDGRWEWHALTGRTYIAVSPCSFASKRTAKRNAQTCVAAFKDSKTTIVWGK